MSFRVGPSLSPALRFSGDVIRSGLVNLGTETITGDLIASGCVNLNGTTVKGDFTGSGNVTVRNSSVKGDVVLSGKSDVNGTTIEGDATIGGASEIQNSTIGGTLTHSSDHLELCDVKVKNITLKSSQRSGSFISGGSGNIVIGGSMTNSVVTGFGGGGRGMISVGPWSSSSVNGYEISTQSDKTLVVVPGGTTYVNGDKKHGNGPDTYAQFKAQKSSAPNIQGPGWKDEGSGRASGSAAAPATPKEPDQIIELKDGSQVSGKIVFEGGNGKVIVHQGSTFSGQVEGGVVENQ